MKTLIVTYKILEKTYQTPITIDSINILSIDMVKSAIVDNILCRDCEMIKKEHNAVSIYIVEKVMHNAIEIVDFRNLY